MRCGATLSCYGQCKYLIRVARNEALRYIEELANRREISYSFDIDISAPSKKAKSPENIAHQKELRKINSTCIKELTPRQREVIEHILADTDVSTRALGKTVGCSHKNVPSNYQTRTSAISKDS